MDERIERLHADIKRHTKTYDELVKLYAILLLDSSETDIYIREICRPIIGDYLVDGDTWGVPPLETVVESLIEHYERTSS